VKKFTVLCNNSIRAEAEEELRKKNQEKEHATQCLWLVLVVLCNNSIRAEAEEELRKKIKKNSMQLNVYGW